jgi:hypothetical protein
MPRILISTTRRIDSRQLTGYDSAWSDFRGAALARGAKAWRFRSPHDDSLYLEFLEFAGEADPRRDPELERAGRELEALAAGRAEEWEDANIQ